MAYEHDDTMQFVKSNPKQYLLSLVESDTINNTTLLIDYLLSEMSDEGVSKVLNAYYPELM